MKVILKQFKAGAHATNHFLFSCLFKNNHFRMASNAVSPQAKILLQQCLSGRLQVQPASEDSEAKFVEVRRAMVVYVCFLKGAEMATIDKMVKAALSVKLCEDDNGKYVSVLDLPADLLIVPQATLGGRLKGKIMQYHNNVDKDMGYELYTAFTQACVDAFAKNPKSNELGCYVKYGTYGNRQVLTLQTNGPYTHQIEF